MTVDQDLSGDMVKVVQYTIVSVATDAQGTARVLYGPETVAFGDDLTTADFTSWILSENRKAVTRAVRYVRYCQREGLEVDLMACRCEEIARRIAGKKPMDLPPAQSDDPLLNPKWHRVAFHVISRFVPVDIDWSQEQA